MAVNQESPDPAVLLCFAVRAEAAAARTILADKRRGRGAVRVLVTGMGQDQAARALREYLSRSRPERVLSCGFAGGLDPRFAPGTVVFEAPAGSTLEAALLKAGASKARFHCAKQVIGKAAEKSRLRESTGADVVDMESAALGAICREQGLAFAIVRVVLDGAGEDLPVDFNQLMTPSLQYGRLAWAILKCPAVIVGLRALHRRSRAATAALARVLERVIPNNDA